MKKKLLIALMAITTAFSGVFGLTACGGDAGNGGSGGNGGNGGNTEHKHTLTLVEEKAATCIADGNSAYYTCSGCDKWFSDKDGKNEITDKESVKITERAEHNYVGNKCSVCGAYKPTEGLEYVLFDDEESYYCAGMGTSKETDIVIADTYNGKPVKYIAEEAFCDNKSLTSVIIPDSVIIVSFYAFDGCTNLIKEENGIYYVDKWVIACDISLTQVTLKSDTKGIAAGAFEDCKALSSIVLPDGLIAINTDAFMSCTSLASA